MLSIIWQDYVCYQYLEPPSLGICHWKPTRLDPWAQEEVAHHLQQVHRWPLTQVSYTITDVAGTTTALNLADMPTPVQGPQMRTFATGATRSSNSDKFDYSGFLSPHALRRFAQYMHKNRLQDDGQLRASDNWKKGLPLASYKESGIRHTIEGFWLAYDEQRWEDCDEMACAIVFNYLGWLHQRATTGETP